jgi:hypothetical protein
LLACSPTTIIKHHYSRPNREPSRPVTLVTASHYLLPRDSRDSLSSIHPHLHQIQNPHFLWLRLSLLPTSATTRIRLLPVAFSLSRPEPTTRIDTSFHCLHLQPRSSTNIILPIHHHPQQLLFFLESQHAQHCPVLVKPRTPVALEFNHPLPTFWPSFCPPTLLAAPAPAAAPHASGPCTSGARFRIHRPPGNLPSVTTVSNHHLRQQRRLPAPTRRTTTTTSLKRLNSDLLPFFCCQTVLLKIRLCLSRLTSISNTASNFRARGASAALPPAETHKHSYSPPAPRLIPHHDHKPLSSFAASSPVSDLIRNHVDDTAA